LYARAAQRRRPASRLGLGGAARILRPATVAAVASHESEPDLAEALELRDELLLACRDALLGVGTRQASALVAHIDALLDLDDEASPGSQR
jgi:hypothetical protein